MIELMNTNLGEAVDVKFLADSVVVTMKNGDTTTITGVTHADIAVTNHQLRITRHSRPHEKPELKQLHRDILVTLSIADAYPYGMVDATVALRPNSVTFSPEVHAGKVDYEVTLNQGVETEDFVTYIW